MSERTKLIMVGYRLKPVPNLDDLLPKAPAEAETDAKAKTAHEKIVDKIRTGALETVYTCTFDEVYIVVPSVKKVRAFKSEKRAADSTPICVDVRNFLLRLFPKAWPDDTHPGYGKPEAIFIGFDPRFFLKLLGLECSLPVHNSPLPVSMWFGNSDHRDIGEAVMPKTESKGLDWPLVLRARRQGLSGDDAAAYDKIMTEWKGPGVNPQLDVDLTSLLAIQLGFQKVSKDE